MVFDPIAIVGRSCVFPGASTPGEFWRQIAAGRDLVTGCPEGRWRIAKDLVMPAPGRKRSETALTDRGGYVRGFEGIFNPAGFAIPAAELTPYDQMVHWVLHTARAALHDAKIDAPAATPARSGAVMGLLALPTEGFAKFAESVWLGHEETAHAADRFSSGLPAHMLARGLKLDLGAFALDAACASSLYAIKLACDSLHEGTADLMLAGAVSRADSLFLHIGFSALNAVSPAGASRPFHAQADGLLPAEGSSFVVLKRLSDAMRAGDTIHGVIRGIGVSNDGRTAGLMSPSAEGQEQAMRSAYRASGLEPAQISLLECHATGTPVGDACEIRSTSAVFEGLRNVPIGSVKSNLGHPMTAAGMAGLMKLLGAMDAGVRPAMLHVDSEAVRIPDLAASPFRVLVRNEEWDVAGPRLAALSSFGFGGNNSHLILEQFSGALHGTGAPRQPAIAVVAMSTMQGRPRMDAVALEMDGLGFPPRDLASSLPQQTAALQGATDALAQTTFTERTGVFVGMGCDAEIARYGLRTRLKADAAEASLDAVCPALNAATVIGSLANIVANRISSKYDFRGASFAVMSEELSGIDAIAIGARALRNFEVDAAVVGAVDLSCETIHQAAAKTVLPRGEQVAGDAAVFFVLKRLDDAERVLAVLDTPDSASAAFNALPTHAHAAAGAMLAAQAVEACASPGARAVADVKSLGGGRRSLGFAAPELQVARPRVYVYSGATKAAVLEALRDDREGNAGPARLAIVAANRAEFDRRRDRALQSLATDGVYYRDAPLAGEMAFVFPGAASAYYGMGRSLMHVFPEILASVARDAPKFAAGASWVLDQSEKRPEPIDRLWGTTLLCQIHARLTLGMLGLKPDAVIGMSSGETNALFAFDAWRDGDAFYDRFTAAGVFDRHLSGEWAVTGGVPWQTWVLNVSEETLQGLLRDDSSLRLIATHAPGEYLVAGPNEPKSAARQRVDFDMVVHAPDLAPFADTWRELHHRETYRPAGNPRFYQHATGASYELTSDSVAEALTAQALASLDYPAVIERAWADGVRVFVEHGPRGGCSSWIRRILGDREHVAIPLDVQSADSVTQAAHAIAQLAVAGVAVDYAKFNERMAARVRTGERRMLTLPAHRAEVVVPTKVPVRAVPVRNKVVSAPQARPDFESYARLLSEEYAQFVEASGAGHRQFLAASERAYAHAAGGRPVVVIPSAAPAPAPVAVEPAHTDKFSRQQLEVAASGNISEVYGDQFKPLDHYRRICRLPMPPLLLVDRVTAIDGEPGSMSTGTVWTETDVRTDSWYLYRGRMPAGIVVESGQADMLLISWLGIDFLTKGERVYRLLGCDLTYHAGLPSPGDTLRYKIQVTGHARQGDIRLFFFQYDCHIAGELLATVRNGQAGFFTEKELADSAGVLWSAESTAPVSDAAPHIPRFPGVAGAYTERQLCDAADGKAFECFGPGFEASATHTRSPGFANQDLLLMDSIPVLDFTGGPWKRGYLRAEYRVRPDHWYFESHFKDDPCLPGTLMYEGCLQAMAFYMMALGFTLGRDSWRFEPVPGIAYPLRCRGQVVPESQLMICELFVDEVIENGEPTLYADLLGTIDGLKAFHCRRMGVRLTPGYPLDEKKPVPARADAGREVAVVNGIRLDYNALLATAWGLPSQAFGPPYARFDRYERCPRLPSPPYHFMTRMARVEGEFGMERAGAKVEAHYDLSPDDWFFASNGAPDMPFAVLLEIALQPCGWLSCFTGIPVRSQAELFFRNLDGTGKIFGRIGPGTGTLITHVTMTQVVRSGATALTSFDVHVMLDGRRVFETKTMFGFFQREDLMRQVGLPASDEELARFGEASDFALDLRHRPARYFEGALRLPDEKLLMIDRITGMWPNRIRAEKTIRPSEWFFKAHFYQDPVQPGSLGLEGIIQTLWFWAIHEGLGQGIENPRFELGEDLVWKYRGQVLPTNRKTEAEVIVRDVTRTAAGPVITAEGSLWVDGTRIYQMSQFSVRIVNAVNR